MNDINLDFASNKHVSLHSSRYMAYIECPCGKTVSGIGLMNQLHTKERWYRLHQKKCEICRPVRFNQLECKSCASDLLPKGYLVPTYHEMVHYLMSENHSP